MEQEQYVKYMKKQCNLLRIIAAMVAGIFLVVLISAVQLVPKAADTIAQAEEVLGNLARVTEDLSDADLPGLIDNLNGLVTESGAGIQEAMETLGAVDIETLNEAIGDLQAIVEPLARLFGR